MKFRKQTQIQTQILHEISENSYSMLGKKNVSEWKLKSCEHKSCTGVFTPSYNYTKCVEM